MTGSIKYQDQSINNYSSSPMQMHRNSLVANARQESLHGNKIILRQKSDHLHQNSKFCDVPQCNLAADIQT